MQNTVFEDMVAFGGTAMTLTGDGEPEQLHGARVSSGYFAVVGFDPVLGRSFALEEHEPAKDESSFWDIVFGNVVMAATGLSSIGP